MPASAGMTKYDTVSIRGERGKDDGEQKNEKMLAMAGKGKRSGLGGG